MKTVNYDSFVEACDKMNRTVKIQKCLDKDVAPTGEFYDKVVLWLDNHENYPKWIYRVYPSERSVLKMSEEGAQYICVSNEMIIGAFAISAEPQGDYHNCRWSRELEKGTYMVLAALAIDPTVQRQGLGSEIIRFCIDKARSEGFKAIRADVVPTNYPARRLFEKNGFIYAGDVDLKLSIGDIPAFSMYEFNW